MKPFFSTSTISKQQNKIVISKGCNCKKSSCLKKYCECYQAGQLCEDQCKCNDCKNRGSLSEVRSIKQATIDNYTKKTRSSKKLERNNQKLLKYFFFISNCINCIVSNISFFFLVHCFPLTTQSLFAKNYLEQLIKKNVNNSNISFRNTKNYIFFCN